MREKDPPWGWNVPTILEESALASNLRLPLFLIIRSLDFRNRIAHVVFVAEKVSLLTNGVPFLVLIEGDGEWECYIYSQNRTTFFAVLLGISQLLSRCYDLTSSSLVVFHCCEFRPVWVVKNSQIRQYKYYLKCDRRSDTTPDPLSCHRRRCTNRLWACTLFGCCVQYSQAHSPL